MVALNIPQEFAGKNIDDVIAETAGGLVLIPEGEYKAVVLNSEIKPTKDGTGSFIAMDIVIANGQYADTKFTERFNVSNKNATAVKIAYNQLGKIAKAVGFKVMPNDTNSFHNKPMVIVVKTETKPESKGIDKMTGLEKTYPATQQSIIGDYKPLPQVNVPVAQQQQQPVQQPIQQQPVQQPIQQQPDANPNNAMPWA